MNWAGISLLVQAYRQKSGFEETLFYMFIGAILGIFIFVMIYTLAESLNSHARMVLSITGFAIFLAFWIGSLRVIIRR